MRTIAKIALWLFGGLAALVALAVTALLLVDWNTLRSTVNEQASAASGRDFAIHGDLNLDIWSWTPQVVARDVVLSNPEWASSPEMLRIAEVYLRLRLMPLFVGRLEIEELRLVRPQVNLEQRGGKANWNFAAATPETAAVEAAAPAEREDFPVLKHAVVEDGILRYRDPALDAPIEVALNRLTVEAGGFDDPVHLTAGGSYQDKPFSIDGEGESFEAFRSTEEPYDLTLEARIGNTRLATNGALTEPVKLAGVDVRLEMEGRSLHELFTLFALPLPESPPYALTGRLTREGNRWALRGFEGRLGESDLRGDIEVATGGERPRLIADVSSKSFRVEDLDSFWGGDGGQAEQQSEEQADAGGHILSDEPLSLPKLRRMDAEVRFQGNSVQSGALRLQDLSADLQLEDGLLTLTPLELGLAEGRIAADLRLDGRQEVPRMAGDIDVEGLNLDALLTLLGLENAGAGLLQGRLEIAMRGRSLRELGASANGEGALIMSGGRIENILLELVALDLPEAAGQWLTDEEEKVKVLCLAMPTKIEDGRFQAQPWILDTTDAIVVISGYVDLGSEKVNLVLEPHPKDFSLFNYLTSIEVTGDLSQREVNTNPIEAAGKVVLKAIVAPIMPLLSQQIQESAQERSVPCPELRERLETAMAEGAGEVAPEEKATAEADESDGGTAGPGDAGGAEDSEQGSAAAAAPGEREPVGEDPATVSRIQSALREAGFELDVDGIMGPNTQAALRAFQERENLQPTGRPNATTLRQLGVAPAED